MPEQASETSTTKPGAPAAERLRAAEREIDKVHLLVLCACAALWLAVFAHYVTR